MSESDRTRLDQLTQKIDNARAKLNSALDKIGERGDEQIYSEGAQWTLRQLTIHLAWADAGHNNMLYHYAEGKPFIPDNYDINYANKRAVEKRAEMTVTEARETLAKNREELLAWLQTVDDSILSMTGRHPAKEDATLEDIMKIIAIHENGHAEDILVMLDTE